MLMLGVSEQRIGRKQRRERKLLRAATTIYMEEESPRSLAAFRWGLEATDDAEMAHERWMFDPGQAGSIWGRSKKFGASPERHRNLGTSRRRRETSPEKKDPTVKFGKFSDQTTILKR
ncbi:hypothetical protein LINGRAHAP2_LOCUS22998 [Linum grandiflorum]